MTNNPKSMVTAIAFLRKIRSLALEIAREPVPPTALCFHSLSHFNREKEEADSVIMRAANSARLSKSSVEALQRERVSELSTPENMAALTEVFTILARWRDESRAKRAVVDDSNRRMPSLRRKDGL